MIGGFEDAVVKKFNSIRNEFETRSYNLFNMFDEDLFMDAYIKCSSTLKDKQMSYQEYIKYYWAAYTNMFKTEYSKPTPISLDDPNRGEIISLSTPYNRNIDVLYEKITESVITKFGHVGEAWVEHIHGKSYKELESMGYNFKFNDSFKKITKWVRENFKKDS